MDQLDVVHLQWTMANEVPTAYELGSWWQECPLPRNPRICNHLYWESLALLDSDKVWGDGYAKGARDGWRDGSRSVYKKGLSWIHSPLLIYVGTYIPHRRIA